MVVLGATLTEGAGNDWIAKATVDGLGTSESTGALMFALFVLAMTAMRFFGGQVIDAYGRVAVLRASMAAAAAGLGLFVLAGNVWLAGLGAALWGVGAALAFPMGMSAAADDPKHAAARVSVVSTLGYVSFLAGPPLLGYLGDLTGIHLALLAILAPIVVALVLAGAAKPLHPAQPGNTSNGRFLRGPECSPALGWGDAQQMAQGNGMDQPPRPASGPDVSALPRREP